MFGATDVSWGIVPGRGETGLDDVLASLPDSRRAKTLKKIVEGAVTKLPPKPKASRKAERIDWIALRRGSRPVLNVDDDRLDVGTEVARLMKDRWDGSRLFMFGDTLTAVESGQPVRVSQETFVHLTHQASNPMRAVRGEGLVPAEYSANTLRITSDICNRSFTHLAGVTKAPFVREDGTVCTTEGYDAASGLLLVPTPGLESVTVPDQPTPAQVAEAVRLLAEEWLGDFPFATDADRANALALVLTPFVRDRVGIVPLAVLDGLGAGVGKGLFAEILSVLVTGETVGAGVGADRAGRGVEDPPLLRSQGQRTADARRGPRPRGTGPGPGAHRTRHHVTDAGQVGGGRVSEPDDLARRRQPRHSARGPVPQGVPHTPRPDRRRMGEPQGHRLPAPESGVVDAGEPGRVDERGADTGAQLVRPG